MNYFEYTEARGKPAAVQWDVIEWEPEHGIEVTEQRLPRDECVRRMNEMGGQMATQQVEPQLDWLAQSAKAAQRARVRRDDGIKRAADHANSVVSRWIEKAIEQLERFIAQRKGAPFLAEEFVSWVQFQIPPPPDRRTYGAVIQRATRAGLIVQDGYARANSSNRSPKCLWKSPSTDTGAAS